MNQTKTASPIHALTSVRFFAAMYVVVFHAIGFWVRDNTAAPAALKNFLLSGHLGVSFFFILSGFILQYVYRGDFDSYTKKRKYAIARFSRIYPVYFLSIIVTIPFLDNLGPNYLAQFFLVQFWCINPQYTMANWNGPAWTLSVEAFFYISYVLFSPYVKHIGVRTILVFIAIISLFMIVSSSPLYTICDNSTKNWFVFIPTPLMRLPEFVLGVMYGELYNRKLAIRLKFIDVFSVLALISTMTIGSSDEHAGYAAAIAGFAIFCIAHSRSGPLNRLLNNNILIFLGSSSFALYLFHQPIVRSGIFIIDNVKYERIFLILQLPIVILVAVAIFKYIEEPMRNMLKKI